MKTRKKIAVIGSGVGGLSAAIRLSAKGHDVTIYEKRDQWGGRAYNYQVNGFSFDGGPTVITAPHMYDELFEAAGKNREDYIRFNRLDPFYRIFKDRDNHFNYWRDRERSVEEVDRFSPSDVQGYRRFLEGTVNIFNWFQPHTEKSFDTFRSFAGIFPHVLGSGTWRSMYQYAAAHVKDDFIRQVCSFHPLLVGGNPFDTPSIYGLIIQFEREWGVHYAQGGTASIVNALGELFLSTGGEIHFNTEVSEILFSGKRASGVRLQDGTRESADLVVCNSDIGFAYRNMIRPSLVPAHTSLFYKHAEYSNSLVVLYFGTDRRFTDSSLVHHNLILGNDYGSLMKDVFRRKKMGKELGLYVHMPTRTDSTIAPEGCESFYALSLVPNLAGSIHWEDIREEYNDRILGFLEYNYLPGLRSSIIAQHSIDPVHFRDTLNSYKGAAFSIKPSFMQSGYFRPQVRSRHFENLFFVGAGVHPGAGLPAVMASGKIAAAMIDPVTLPVPQWQPSLASLNIKQA